MWVSLRPYNHAEVTSRITLENNTKNMTDFTDFLWPILCHFGHRRPSLIPGFLDCARRRNTRDYTSCPHCATVFALIHEQPYHAEAHLFQTLPGPMKCAVLEHDKHSHKSKQNKPKVKKQQLFVHHCHHMSISRIAEKAA